MSLLETIKTKEDFQNGQLNYFKTNLYEYFNALHSIADTNKENKLIITKLAKIQSHLMQAIQIIQQTKIPQRNEHTYK